MRDAGYPSAALKFHELELELAEESGDEKGMIHRNDLNKKDQALAHHFIGICLMVMYSLFEAISHFEIALELGERSIARDRGGVMIKIRALTNLGECYRKLAEFDFDADFEKVCKNLSPKQANVFYDQIRSHSAWFAKQALIFFHRGVLFCLSTPPAYFENREYGKSVMLRDGYNNLALALSLPGTEQFEIAQECNQEAKKVLSEFLKKIDSFNFPLPSQSSDAVVDGLMTLKKVDMLSQSRVLLGETMSSIGLCYLELNGLSSFFLGCKQNLKRQKLF